MKPLQSHSIIHKSSCLKEALSEQATQIVKQIQVK